MLTNDYKNVFSLSTTFKFFQFNFFRFNYIVNFVFFKNFSYAFFFLNKLDIVPPEIDLPFKIVKYNNFFKVYKKFKFFNFHLRNNRFLLNFLFKYNRFFRYSKFKLINLKRKKHPFFNNLIPYFFFEKKKLIKQKWHFLVGKPIHLLSPSVFFFSTIFLKNIPALAAMISKLFFKRSRRIKNDKLFTKKFIINNFYYLKKKKINFKNFKFLMKLNLKKKKLFVKKFKTRLPYLFLNNPSQTRANQRPSGYPLLRFYKFYKKLFKSFKLFKFRLRKKRIRTKVNKINIFRLKSHNFLTSKYKKFFIFNKRSLKTTFKFKRFIYNSSISKKKVNRIVNIRAQFLFPLLPNRSKSVFIKYKKLRRKFTRRLKIWYYLSINLHRIAKLPKRVNLIKFKTFFKIKKNRYFYFKKSPTFFSLNRFKINLIKPLMGIFKFNKKIISRSNYKNFFIYKNYKPFVFLIKEGPSFALNMPGFLFLTENVFDPHTTEKKTYVFKKILYSFAKKNEMQRYILKRYLKHQLVNFQPKNETYLNDLAYFSEHSTPFSFEPKAHSWSLINSSMEFKSWYGNKKKIQYWKNIALEPSYINIKRIRFKPGYMKTWREAREVLKYSLGLKIRYQYSLTNYLFNFLKFLRLKTYLVLEMSLQNILIRSRFFPDTGVLKTLIRENFFFVNGKVTSNNNLQLFLGDFVQIIISFKYYIFHRWLLNNIVKKKQKLRLVSKKKLSLPDNHEEKQKSNNLSRLVLRNKNIIDDVAKYLEIDYFTLSFFIIYEPFLWSDVNFYNIKDTRFSIINTYNWKYIT